MLKDLIGGWGSKSRPCWIFLDGYWWRRKGSEVQFGITQVFTNCYQKGKTGNDIIPELEVITMTTSDVIPEPEGKNHHDNQKWNGKKINFLINQYLVYKPSRVVSGIPFEKEFKVQVAMYRVGVCAWTWVVSGIAYCSVVSINSVVSNKPLCCLVSVRVGLKGTGIDDSCRTPVGNACNLVRCWDRRFWRHTRSDTFWRLEFGAVPFEAFGFHRARDAWRHNWIGFCPRCWAGSPTLCIRLYPSWFCSHNSCWCW